MSGRHLEDVLPPRRVQRMGEECRYKGGPGKPPTCPFGCDLGGNGRHRASTDAEFSAALDRAADAALAAFRELHDDEASWWDRMRARSSSQAGTGTFGGAR